MVPSQITLQSGETFQGFSPEWQQGHFSGEVVFTTGMTGYVESLTDPSYAGQLLTFTYPLIGNYGVPDKKYWESDRIQAAGAIMGCLSESFSHQSAKESLASWFKKEKIPLITGIDTRALTKYLRRKGTALGAILCNSSSPKEYFDPNSAHLVAKVSIKTKKRYGKGKKKIIAVDCGMKENIIRCLQNFPVTIDRVPYNYDYSQEEFDGIFLSNGPGNPELCVETIAILQKVLPLGKPIFGICLGAQIMALAIGGKTYKLKFGHRGHNQPCFDLQKNQCLLTSQNHGWAIDEKTLPSDWKVLLRHLNDDSVEGIIHKTKPYFAVQFHPESSPGPNDAYYFFETFYGLL